MRRCMSGRSTAGRATPTGVASMVGTIIQRFGTDELKREVLPKIVCRRSRSAASATRSPAAAPTCSPPQTRATPDGDGWRIDGQKMFTSGANLADYVLMLTRTNPDVPKHKGLTMFIVPLKARGRRDPAGLHLPGRAHEHHLLRRREDPRQLSPRRGRRRREGRCPPSLELEHGGGFAKSPAADAAMPPRQLCREIAIAAGR